MSRSPGSLTLYVARLRNFPGDTRLIVARNFEQAESMVNAGWAVKVASVMDAYRLGKLGIELTYYYPQKERVTE